MNKKSKWFNKAVYDTYIKRFAFISIIYLFVTEVFLDYFYIGTSNISYKKIDGIKVVAENLINYNYKFLDELAIYYIFTIMILSVVYSLALFSYVRNEKALSMVHSMPVSRRSLYFTNFVVFITLIGSALLIHTVMILIHLSFLGFPFFQTLSLLFIRVIFNMILAVTVFAFSVFVGMLVSNFILQIGLVAIFFGAPAILYQLFRNIFSYLLKGYNTTVGSMTFDIKITPYYFLVDMMRIFSPKNKMDIDMIAPYISTRSLIFTLILLVLSVLLGYVLYEKRDLEKCSDFIVFKSAKKVITLIIALMLSLLFANIFSVTSIEILNVNNATTLPIYIGAFAGALLGYIIMKLISEKSINIVKHLLNSVIFAVVIVAIIFVVDMDVFGYEKYVPKANDVEVAYVYKDDYSLQIESKRSGIRGLNDVYGSIERNMRFNFEIIKLSGYEDVSELIERHKKLMEDSKDTISQARNTKIVYVLKNGKIVERGYPIDFDSSNMKGLAKLDSNREYLTKSYYADINKYKELFMRNGDKALYIEDNLGDTKNIPIDKADSFFKAYEKDYVEYIINKTANPNLNGLNMLTVYSDSLGTIPILTTFDSTGEWLGKNGFANIVRTRSSGEVETIVIRKGTGKNAKTLFKITDKVLIKEFMEYSNNEKHDKKSSKVSRDEYFEIEYHYSNGDHATIVDSNEVIYDVIGISLDKLFY